jgi:signal transduction histidine kinase
MSPDLVRKINLTSPSSLKDKSIYIYDSTYKPIFSYSDTPDDTIYITNIVVKKAFDNKRIYFMDGDRNGVAIKFIHEDKKYVIVTVAYDDDKNEWISKLRLILLISFFASVSIVVITGYIFSVGLVKSMSDLTRKINEISSAQFSLRLETGKGKDELQKLAQTINNLLDRLQSSFDTQRRFIDNASHELSTPLASISSQLDVALQKERTTEDYKAVMRSVNDDVKRLVFLVRSLLEIAKVSGSAKGIELSEIRVDELLMRLPSEMKKIKQSYEVRLAFDEMQENEDDLTVYGNEELLFSALKNIVQNACKFSADNTATIRLSSTSSQIKITVEDHGPGIAAHEIDRIFQPFYRSPDITNIATGSGLGLPLANQIIKLYSGEIYLHTELGKGSVFTILLKTASAF